MQGVTSGYVLLVKIHPPNDVMIAKYTSRVELCKFPSPVSYIWTHITCVVHCLMRNTLCSLV